MLESIGVIIILGIISSYICKKIKLPSLIGMLIVGILIGPYVFNLVDTKVLNISSEIRKIALIIILTRAGLSLDINGLKRIGRPALLMCFVPATCELIGILIFAPLLLHVSLLEAAIMGSVLAAVSPAVVVPRMVKLIDEGYGKQHSIPELILAGASVDDVYVIVLFSSFTNIATGNEVSILSFINIPVSIILGILIGLLCGYLLSKLYKLVNIDNIYKVLILLSVSFILVALEDMITIEISFASLISIMFMGIMISKQDKQISLDLSSKYNALWKGAEIFLFVLVGTCVNITYAANAGVNTILVILLALVFRMGGVYLCLIKTKLTKKEKIFSMVSYIPKATVQAAIGSIPLSMGLSCGDSVLTIAVLAIIITAPLGALLIDNLYPKLLTKN